MSLGSCLQLGLAGGSVSIRGFGLKSTAQVGGIACTSICPLNISHALMWRPFSLTYSTVGLLLSLNEHTLVTHIWVWLKIKELGKHRPQSWVPLPK